MSRGARRGLLALGLGAMVALSGCGFSTRLLSSTGEYESYRAVRAGYTPEARLQAARSYLASFPKGRFADEVRERFGHEESDFYRLQSRTPAGLAWYLQTLPDGPHASDASLQLVELERRAAQQREDELVLRGRTMERRLARAASSRKQMTELVVGWVATLASSQAWGRPTWEQPPELLRTLRSEPEPGRCQELRCARGLTISFQVPVAGGGLEERAATFDLGLTLEGGGVSRGWVRGPALFSRFYEAAHGQALSPDPLLARAEAVSHALETVTGAFEAVAPGAQCDRGITPPVVMRRVCDGWTITVTAGDQPADDDIIEVAGPRGKP